MRRITKRPALKLMDQYNRGAWRIRHERVPCAAGTGDSGFRDIYNNGERDILAVEYPHARYKVWAFALV